MTKIPFTAGWHRLDDSGTTHAYLLPDGSWGLSNAGLVRGDGASMLIDTQFSLPMTRNLIAAAGPLLDPSPSWLAITHGHGDHTFGAELFPGAEMLASARCIDSIDREVTPEMLRALGAAPGPIGDYVRHAFGQFDFNNITVRHPTVGIDAPQVRDVGGVEVRLIPLAGPAHTEGDLVVHVPDQGVVYTGDLVFGGEHTLKWAPGSFDEWIGLLRGLAADGAHTFVPGHGPVMSADDILDYCDYLARIEEQAVALHGAGIGYREAAMTMDLDGFDDRRARERLVITTAALYAHLGTDEPTDLMSVLGEVARAWADAKAEAGA
ncbi:MAG TPA: MBL fold metallo-hydrolase [Thermoleophilia bacterium]|nr:MBL fold metallo-hydrolase [Thermoleophilia bacterium]